MSYAEKQVTEIKKSIEDSSISEAIKAYNRSQGWDENTGSGH